MAASSGTDTGQSKQMPVATLKQGPRGPQLCGTKQIFSGSRGGAKTAEGLGQEQHMTVATYNQYELLKFSGN